MTNSDNGNRPRTAAHHPGDRVRVKHNLRHDHHSYSVEQNRARQALAGQIGSIRERAPSGAYRVAPPGSTFARAAWFEADELEPVASHAVGDRVKVAHRPELDRQFSTPSGAFARRRNDGYKGKITAESCGLFEVDTSGPERAWFDPSELEPVAEPVAVAPDPLALASRQAEEALQAADRWRAEYQTAKDELGAVQLALGETQREAKDARQEAREAKDALRAAEAERDALRAACQDAAGTLSLSTVDLAAKVRGMGSAADALRGACEAVVGPAVGVSAGALAASVRAAWSILKAEQAARYDALACERAAHEATSKAADALRGKLGAAAAEVARALVDERAARQAAEERIAAVAQAWSEARDAWRSGDAVRRHRAEEAVDKALGGVAAKPAERECCWEQTVEQRVSEIEARLGRLESGGARRP